MTDRLALPHRYRDQLEALLSKHDSLVKTRFEEVPAI